MMKSIPILLTLFQTSYAQTKYATALIRNSDGGTNDIQGVVRFEQYVHDKMTFREIFFFLRTKIQLFFSIFFRTGDGTSDVTVTWENLQGLSEGEHGFHIHQYGDITSNSPATTGFHFVPVQICSPVRPSTVATYRQERVRMTTNCVSLILAGWPPSQDRHPGDMGNITSGTKSSMRVGTR